MPSKDPLLKSGKPEVSVIVPCYNEERTITLLLEAIKKQTFPLNRLEVVVADALSSDQTRQKIADFAKANPKLIVKLVDNPKRTIPAAINSAVRAASGVFIVRLDAHSIPNNNYIELCIHALKKGKGACVGGVWDIVPGGEGWIAVSIAAAAAHPLGVGDALYRFTNQARVVDTVPFGAFRKDLFESIGGFNENLLTNEDYEFFTRIRKNGGKIWLDPAIRCTYFARSNLTALTHQYWRYGYWKYRMLVRYPNTLRWRQALPPLFVLSLIVLLLASFFFPFARIILACVFGIYLTALMLTSLATGIKHKDVLLVMGMPLAVTTMHFCWGAGFLYSMIIELLFRK